MLVFENLNSKGLPLSEFDLIRNLIISKNNNKSEPKEKLKEFNKKIKNIIDQGTYLLKIKDQDKEEVIEEFFKNYIIFITQNNLQQYKNYKIYRNLKKLYENDFINFNYDDLLQEFKKYFILFLEISNNLKFCSDDNKRLIKNGWINSISSRKIHFPYIFKLFEKFSTFDKVSSKWVPKKEEWIWIIKFIKLWAKYVIKLTVVEGQGNSLLGETIPIIRELDKLNIHKNNFEEIYKSTKKIILKYEENKNITLNKFLIKIKEDPNIKSWIQKGLLNIIKYEYRKTQKTNEIINYENGESLEHIMPQRPYGHEWKNINIQTQDFKDNINKLGNLIVLDKNFNTRLSNKDFHSKKKQYEKSNSIWMKNKKILDIEIKPLIEYEEWNYKTIEERTNTITKIIEKIFSKDE